MEDFIFLIEDTMLYKEPSHYESRRLSYSARATITKYHYWVAQTTKIYFSQFWRLQVQDRGVSEFGFSSGLSP